MTVWVLLVWLGDYRHPPVSIETRDLAECRRVYSAVSKYKHEYAKHVCIEVRK